MRRPFGHTHSVSVLTLVNASLKVTTAINAIPLTLLPNLLFPDLHSKKSVMFFINVKTLNAVRGFSHAQSKDD